MKNILLIEDEENLNRGISLKLKKEGYAVFSAACVSEGLKLFQDNTIDLVICDIGLPDGSGLDLCANIRQRSDVLFLFLTALDTEVDVITGYEMGADDYVTKPFSMSVLVSKISAMLKRTEKAVSNIVQTGKLTFYIDEKRVVKGDNGENGVLSSDSITEWADNLISILKNPAVLIKMRSSARTTALLYDEKSIANQILESYAYLKKSYEAEHWLMMHLNRTSYPVLAKEY